MDPNERFFRRSLRDVLVSQGIVSQEEADELVESAYRSNEPFGSVVVEAGYLTAWDLAKTIASHYQMPVLHLEGYDFDEDLLAAVPASTLYQYQVVPVGRFGKTWSFSCVEAPGKECVEALRESCGPSIYFFVSEVQQVQGVLQERVKVVDVAADDSWQDIFDSGDEAVKSEVATGSSEES